MIAITACAFIAAACLSGCNFIFSGFNKCDHEEGKELKFDSSVHYYECVKCGERCRARDHLLKEGYDDTDHYSEGCVICDYVVDSTRVPHTLGEWGTFSRHVNEKSCTAGCGYKVLCDHTEINEENEEYVIKDGQHVIACKLCKMPLTYRYDKKTGVNYKYALQDHRYNQYKDVNEETHVAHCVCGAIKGEAESHTLKYHGENGYHRLLCDCGFGNEEESCTYNYVYDTLSHYQQCTVCQDKVGEDGHDIVLAFGERKCETCGYVNEWNKELRGTWRRETPIDKTYYVIVFSTNWTYEVRTNEGVISEGKYNYNGYVITFERTSGQSMWHIYAENVYSSTSSFKDGNTTYTRQ